MSDPGSVSFASRPARLSQDLFDLLFGGCRPEHFDAGEHLFMQEDPGDRIYGVLSGTVEISIYGLTGRKLVANIELSRSLIGEIGALDGGPRTASALCLTGCTLVSLSRVQFLDRLEKNSHLAIAMIGLLCARLRWVSGERSDQALLKIETRLAKRLLFLSGVLADKDGWIPISQADLAAFLGATRESVNKMLNEWRGRSLIAIRRSAIRVTNANGLQAIVDLDGS
ncbi:Crp/Fnr family transcriptional regulator [Nitratireductor sp. GCM10026969]|uniref:Crp/Fnr family transcriptional regulator n=1 Tax=Nitratireductor sp. GCM10026969 TaxID=3252645 RepID=UPI003619FB4E